MRRRICCGSWSISSPYDVGRIGDMVRNAPVCSDEEKSLILVQGDGAPDLWLAIYAADRNSLAGSIGRRCLSVCRGAGHAHGVRALQHGG